MAPTKKAPAKKKKTRRPQPGNISTPPSNISAPPENISVPLGNISAAPGNISVPLGNISATPGDISTAPRKISAAPGNTSTATGNISAHAGKISAATENTSATPGKISAAPGNIPVAPSNTSAAPSNVSTIPRKISTAPRNTSTAPSNTSAAPSNISTAPGKISAAPRNTSAAPRNTSTAPGNTSAAPGNISAAPGKISAAPGNTSTAPGNTSAAPGNTSAAPGNISAAPGKISAAPGNTSTATGNISAAPGNISAAPGNVSAAPGKISAATRNISSATGKLTLPTTEEGTVPNMDQPTSQPTRKHTVSATEEGTVPNMDLPVSQPPRKHTVPATEERTVPNMDQPVSQPTRKHTVSATEERTVPNMDQPISQPTRKHTVSATEERTVSTTKEHTSPPIRRHTLPTTEERTAPITKEHTLSTTEEGVFPITKGYTFPVTGKRTLTNTKEFAFPTIKEHAFSITGKHTLSTTEDRTVPIDKEHTSPTPKRHILPRSPIHEEGDVPGPHKPGDDNCSCWFRKLGENPTKEAHLPPPPLGPESDVVPLDVAKKNLSHLYQPLREWQTRIITVLPAHSSEPLRCELWTVNLIHGRGVAVSGTPKIVTYKALSYSWGSGSPTAQVICNNVKVLVNDTLASVLGVLRDHKKEIRIWCDALCINQSDPAEKAQQVRNMLKIFEKAERVIAWVGPPDRWTLPLFHFLSDKEDGSKDPSCSPHAAMKYGLGLSDWRHDPECRKNVSEIVRAAGEHLRRPWFRRTWVRQEVFGTSNLTIYCGRETTSLSNLITATQKIFDFEQRLLSNPQQADISPSPDQRNVPKSLSEFIPASVFVLQESYKHAGIDCHDYKPPRHRLRYSAHWLGVLNRGADFEVTDPRDKVYGVLGIITSPTTRWYVESRPDIEDIEFPINYTKSVSAVYEDVVKHLVNLDRNLDALQVFEDRCQRAKDLPSWVTDWRQNISRSIVRCAPDDESERNRIGQAPIQSLNDVGKLRLEGVKLGGPLKGINVYKGKWKAPTFPEPERMDPNYEQMISSDCFVWGRFSSDRSFLVGGLVDLLDSGDLQGCHILVPRVAKLDDILVAVLGSSTLFLLRPRPNDEYKFLGPVIRRTRDLPDWSRFKMQTFVLV